MKLRSYFLTAIASLWFTVTSAVYNAVAYVGSLFEYRPGTGTALDLDRLGHDAAAVDRRSTPFKAFIERALGHDDFITAHFDPGRSFA